MHITWRKEWTLPCVTACAGFGAGLMTGFVISSRRKSGTTKIAEVVERDGKAVIEKTAYDEIVATERYTPTVVEGEQFAEFLLREKEEVIEVASEESGTTIVADAVTVNVFERSDDPNWDYETELAHRASDKPYMLHRDEYFGEEKGYGQSTLTYYAGDDVLVDENDVPIPRPVDVIGEVEFGKGSGDPNTAYARNERLEAEYEIVRDPGHFAVEVLGVQTEEALSKERPIIHKMRQDN